MLKGFHVPLTAKGLSTLNPTPPWHYSCDLLSIEFWANPRAVTAMLPSALSIDPRSEGRASAFFCDWQFSGDNDEYLDPARYQYREFFILLDCLYEEQPVSYCANMFVDNDAALARGWSEGYPKRIASVYQTRHHAAPSKASPPLAAGSRFAASASANGQRLADALVTLTAPAKDFPEFAQRPIVNLLHYPQLTRRQTAPTIHQLVMNVPRDMRFESPWVGEGHLSLPICYGEEVSDLAPLRCGYGLRASMSYTVDDLRILRDL
jgi:acetoacetate decarboxylase